MKRRYKEFLIKHDGMQWVVQKEYLWKDKEGNDKLMLSSKSYFAKIESVAVHIGNSQLADLFNEKCENILDELGVGIEN